MSPRRPARRRGYTLMELVVASAAATLLMSGLTSAVLISTSAFQLDSGTQAQKTEAAAIQADLMADLQHALSFSERTANAVTFTVPDRSGDGNAETIRYAWSGTPGDPLTYSYNGGTAVNLADDVQAFDLSYLTRTMAPSCQPPTFEEFTEAKQDSGSTSITIDTPSGTFAGDLLIAAVATDEDTDEDLNAPSGWTLIAVDAESDDVTLGVWWKIAGASESSSHTFDWSGGSSEEAYGWIMRFTGHDPDNPIHAFKIDTHGNDYTPKSPKVTTTVDNALILRMGGFDDDNVTHNATGLSGHTTITMDESDSGDGTVSGGAGFALQAQAGDSGEVDFSLNDDEQSVTVTVAIAGVGCGAGDGAGSGSSGPVYHEYTETKDTSDGTSINIAKPSGTITGDLLVAAVSIEHDQKDELSAPAGWNVIDIKEEDHAVTFGVWWKIASSSEPSSYTFSWAGGSDEDSYGWIMRFSGHDPADPIDDSANARGDSSSPTSPGVTTTANNALVLRLGGFDSDDIT